MSNESLVNDPCLAIEFTESELISRKLNSRRAAAGKIEVCLLRCTQYVHSSFGRAYCLVKNRVKSLVERHHNPRVGGSNPSTATSKKALWFAIAKRKGSFLLMTNWLLASVSLNASDYVVSISFRLKDVQGH